MPIFFFMTKSLRKNVPDERIESATVRMPGKRGATTPSSGKILTSTEYLQFNIICSELSLSDILILMRLSGKEGEREGQMRLSEYLDPFHRSLLYT